MDIFSITMILIMVATFLFFYMLPSCVGWIGHVSNLKTVVLVNALTGWTVIGWCVAMIMVARHLGGAMFGPKPAPVIAVPAGYTLVPTAAAAPATPTPTAAAPVEALPPIAPTPAPDPNSMTERGKAWLNAGGAAKHTASADAGNASAD